MNSQMIALIPARKGSKGVTRKNMRLVDGIPLVGYTLHSALGSRYVSNIFVSSDDHELLNYASSLGCNCIVRPEEYAEDSSTANHVIQHFISGLNGAISDHSTLIAYLQPTSPRRDYRHIDDAYEGMLEAGLSLITAKLVFVGIFVFFTSPIAGHAVVQAAYEDGVKPEGENKISDKSSSRKRSPKKSAAK